MMAQGKKDWEALNGVEVKVVELHMKDIRIARREE
jgi:hypothetical protein